MCSKRITATLRLIIVSHVNTPLGCFIMQFPHDFFLVLVAKVEEIKRGWEGLPVPFSSSVEGVAGCVRPSGRTDAAVSWRHPGVYPTHHSVVYRPLYALCTSHYASLVPSHTEAQKSNDATAIREDCGGGFAKVFGVGKGAPRRITAVRFLNILETFNLNAVVSCVGFTNPKSWKLHSCVIRNIQNTIYDCNTVVLWASGEMWFYRDD